jgi:hypothetical protein
VVVGSGPGGATTAREVARRGNKERGLDLAFYAPAGFDLIGEYYPECGNNNRPPKDINGVLPGRTGSLEGSF